MWLAPNRGVRLGFLGTSRAFSGVAVAILLWTCDARYGIPRLGSGLGRPENLLTQIRRITILTLNSPRDMKLKSLLLASLLSAAVSPALAQSSNVFSVNAVGYVNLSLAPGFSMISNPLNATNNVVGTLFPDAPNGFVIFKFNPAANNYDLNFRNSGAWSVPNMALSPGEGIFIFNNQASNVVVTYVGEVPQGALTNSLPTGFTIRSSQVPQAGALESLLQFPGVSGDLVFVYNRVNNNYDIFVRGASSWSPSDPNISVAQSFFLFRNVAGSWVRNFSVNQ
jgi:hypothetical protein